MGIAMSNRFEKYADLQEQSKFIDRLVDTMHYLKLAMTLRFGALGGNITLPAVIVACPDCHASGRVPFDKHYRHGVEKDYKRCETCKGYGVALVYIDNEALGKSLSEFVASAKKITAED